MDHGWSMGWRYRGISTRARQEAPTSQVFAQAVPCGGQNAAAGSGSRPRWIGARPRFAGSLRRERLARSCSAAARRGGSRPRRVRSAAGAGVSAALDVGVRGRQQQVSDIVGIDPYVAMQSIAHFLDEPLPLGGARVIRFGEIHKETHDGLQG